MVDCRMDIKNNEEDIAKVEQAHYILLSLYREYSIILLNDASKKDYCISKMRQIKNDIKFLTRKQLIEKSETFYKKILQNMEHTQYDGCK